MIQELQVALADYQAKWQALAKSANHPSFFETLPATALGYKTVDLDDFDRRFAALRTRADVINTAKVNNRWIATFHLPKSSLPWGIRIIKLMQRRPESTDATGLDHVDFYRADEAAITEVLKNEPTLKWTHETDNPHCDWYSVWFAGTEAKLRTGTVLDVCIAELNDANRKVLGKSA